MTVFLQWQPSDGASGYRLEWGTTPFEHVVDVGPATMGAAEIQPWGTWYFSATAYNGDDDVSGPSNQITLSFAQMAVAQSGVNVVVSTVQAAPSKSFLIFSTDDLVTWQIVNQNLPESNVFYWTDNNAVPGRKLRVYAGAIEQ